MLGAFMTFGMPYAQSSESVIQNYKNAFQSESFQLPGDDFNTTHWTAGAEHNGRKIYGRAEYIAANDGGVKRDGAYGLLVWKFIPNQWEALGKYDYYNGNIQVKNDYLGDLTFGVNYYFAYLSRIQLNYIYSDDKAVGKNNAFAVQLQVFF